MRNREFRRPARRPDPATGAGGGVGERPLPAWAREMEQRLLSQPGFMESLTPEQIAAIEAYDGPEVLGPPPAPPTRRRPGRA